MNFIRDIVRRGQQAPVLVTTDGPSAPIRALTEVWGRSLQQHCLAHKMRNILDKLPRDAQVEIKRRVRDVFYAPSLEMAQELAPEVLADDQEV